VALKQSLFHKGDLDNCLIHYIIHPKGERVGMHKQNKTKKKLADFVQPCVVLYVNFMYSSYASS